MAEAIVTTQRDWGNRTERKNAKTKYTLERVGLTHLNRKPNGVPVSRFPRSARMNLPCVNDQIGWLKGIDDHWHLTLFIENGRLIDFFGQTAENRCGGNRQNPPGRFRLTANQNLIIAGIPEAEKSRIESLCAGTRSYQRQRHNCCGKTPWLVSFPTCPLAMAEAERFLPEFVTEVEKIMSSHGVGNEEIVLRVTGCPNGCGRAMLSEVGLVGKAPDRYNLHLGGNPHRHPYPAHVPRKYQLSGDFIGA